MNLTPGRIGQASEPTSPSRPRPADHDRRSASSEGGGETGWSLIVGVGGWFAQYLVRTRL